MKIVICGECINEKNVRLCVCAYKSGVKLVKVKINININVKINMNWILYFNNFTRVVSATIEPRPVVRYHPQIINPLFISK